MDIKSILYKNGILIPFRIELEESSGPVSPKFQFNTHVVVSVVDGVPTLTVDDEGEYRDGKPARSHVGSSALSTERTERLWSDLVAADALHAGGDLIGDAGRKRMGVSFNRVSIEIGEERARIDYLRSLLEEESPDHAPQRAVIALIKALVSEAK